jgi:hypothetical protein
MNKVLRYNEYQSSVDIAEKLIEMIVNPKLNESVDDSHIKNILKSLSRDLKFNYNLVLTFGTGIKAMIPVVDNLIKNSKLNIELTTENLVLLTITALSITYLEEKNNRIGSEEIECLDCEGTGFENPTNDLDDNPCSICLGYGSIKSKVTKKDTDTLLAELKLRGIGDNIVKKVITCFKSIGNIFKIIFRNTPYIISGFLDMLGYTAILLPSMNAISALIGEYHFNIDTLPANLLSVGLGIGTFLAKNGFNYLVNKLKDKFNLKINPDLNNPTFLKSIDINDGDTKDMDNNKLIKEQ